MNALCEKKLIHQFLIESADLVLCVNKVNLIDPETLMAIFVFIAHQLMIIRMDVIDALLSYNLLVREIPN
jgi:hypothetical protein